MSESTSVIARLLMVSTLSLSASVAVAGPSISTASGNLAHGDTLAISGTGFGTKATAAPIRWETFEDGTVGQSITTTGYWSAETPSQTLFDDDTPVSTRHSHSDKHIRWYSPPSSSTRPFYRDNVGFESTGKAYVNTWLYMDFVSGDPELSTGWQLKLFRIQGGHSHGTPPYFLNNLCTLDDETVSYWVVPIHHNPSLWPGSGWMEEHYWVNMIMEYKDSSLDTSDGQAHFYSSDAPLTDGAYRKFSRTNIETRYDDITGYVDCLLMGYLLVNGGEEASTYWDDIYIDKYWARVEIGDASTYANCKHREMQIPSTWSDTSVTVTLNQGSFDQLDSKYLYVVDNDGAVSASGYLLEDMTPTLTVTNGSGSGEYEAGTVVAVSADPAPSGKVFGMWIGDNEYIADPLASPTTLTMPSIDASVTATYAWGYQLTVNSGTGGGLYAYGTVVDVLADAAPSNMAFDEWTGDTAGLAGAELAETTYTMPSHHCEVTATYQAALSGDLDCSGFVGQGDLDIVLDNWGMSPPADPRADPTGDNFVGQDDLDVVLDNWGAGL